MRTLLLATTLLVGAVCSNVAYCPLHNSMGTFLRDEFPGGKHVKVFKCSWGHEFSVVC